MAEQGGSGTTDPLTSVTVTVAPFGQKTVATLLRRR